MVEMNLENIQKQKPIQELLEFCIINVNKPSGSTSFDVVEKIRKILGVKKTGHFGTLDPKVTGVLPVAINRACRLTRYFMHKDKEYVGKMYLHSEISKAELEEEMKKFTGKIMQKPPVKSRVKRVERERMINRFEITDKQGKEVDFIADVEAGTYIRKLIHDLGEKRGGAHMIELRRIKAGIFEEDKSFKIEEIKHAFKLWKEKKDDSKLRKILIPAEIISEILPIVQTKPETVKSLLNGRPFVKSDLKEKLPDSELFAVFCEERFIEIARKVNKKDIIARPEFVLN